MQHRSPARHVRVAAEHREERDDQPVRAERVVRVVRGRSPGLSSVYSRTGPQMPHRHHVLGHHAARRGEGVVAVADARERGTSRAPARTRASPTMTTPLATARSVVCSRRFGGYHSSPPAERGDEPAIRFGWRVGAHDRPSRSVLLAVLVRGFGGSGDFVAAARSARPSWVAVAFAAATACVLLTTVRWQLVLRRHGVHGCGSAARSRWCWRTLAARARHAVAGQRPAARRWPCATWCRSRRGRGASSPRRRSTCSCCSRMAAVGAACTGCGPGRGSSRWCSLPRSVVLGCSS